MCLGSTLEGCFRVLGLLGSWPVDAERDKGSNAMARIGLADRGTGEDKAGNNGIFQAKARNGLSGRVGKNRRNILETFLRLKEGFQQPTKHRDQPAPGANQGTDSTKQRHPCRRSRRVGRLVRRISQRQPSSRPMANPGLRCELHVERDKRVSNCNSTTLELRPVSTSCRRQRESALCRRGSTESPALVGWYTLTSPETVTSPS